MIYAQDFCLPHPVSDRVEPGQDSHQSVNVDNEEVILIKLEMIRSRVITMYAFHHCAREWREVERRD